MRLLLCALVWFHVLGQPEEGVSPAGEGPPTPVDQHWWSHGRLGGRHHHFHEEYDHGDVGGPSSPPPGSYQRMSFVNRLPPPPHHHSGTITVIGEGSVSALPDSAVVSVSVAQIADRPLKAKEMLHERLAEIQSSLSMDEDTLTIKPERYRVNKNYSWKNDGTRELQGYEASQELKFSVYNLTQLDVLVDRMLEEDDLTDVRDIDLQVKDPVSALEEARRLAVADTQRKASAILSGYGRGLGSVIKVEENRDGYAAPSMERVMMARAAESTGPIYQGKPVDFHVSLTATFEIGAPLPCIDGMICEKETPATA